MRGIPVVQIPTTLLAMVDSSIGGKTGVDTPAGKNLIGAFHQPRRVYIDPSLLVTLPVREISNGMAEIIKTGAIADGALFDLLESRADDILGKEVEAEADINSDGNVCRLRLPGQDASSGPDAVDGQAASSSSIKVKARILDFPLLQEVIAAGAGVKVRVVTADEREGGLRATLNFGHTIGHGIEALMQPALLHGECVAIGMVKETEISRALGHIDSSVVNRIKRVCKAYGLPTAVPASVSSGRGLRDVMQRMAVDKKNTKTAADGATRMQVVLLKRIGEVISPPFSHAVSSRLIERVLSAAVTVVPRLQPGVDAAQPTVVRCPGSKSISNRALLLAGLSEGTTTIHGLLASDDTQVMLACLSDMGAVVRTVAGQGQGEPDAVMVTGTGGRFTLPPASKTESGGFKHLYVQNAGTASRFLASILCLLPYDSHCPSDGHRASYVTLEGNARMGVRPIGPLVSALREQGAMIEYGGKDGCPPLRCSRGISLYQDSTGAYPTPNAASAPIDAASSIAQPAPGYVLRRRLIRLEAKVSSQYVSSVLMAAPYFPPLHLPASTAAAAVTDATAVADPTNGDPSFIELLLAEEHPTSLPYITMTLVGRHGVCDCLVHVLRWCGAHSIVLLDVDRELNPPLSVYLSTYRIVSITHPISIRVTITPLQSAMLDFGITVIRLADNRYLIPRQAYTAPSSGLYHVEADASSASYPAAIAALTGRTVILDGVGSRSVQGDASFPLLLAKMGCSVTQEERRTIITGPAHAAPSSPSSSPSSRLASVDPAHPGLRGIDVNMEEQTDCFMTLAAVAAVSFGTTRITGIANQRVKECNRIAAMVAELGKCGVTASELPDGIQIEGTGQLGGSFNGANVANGSPVPPPTVAHGATIHCYDDHRIAMSFACLGLAVPGIVLDDAECTGKTYPEFWDCVESTFGYPVLAADALAGGSSSIMQQDAAPDGGSRPHCSSLPSSSSPAQQLPRSVILIGMRGAGKSSLAAAAAEALGSTAPSSSSSSSSWSSIDMDRHLESTYASRHGLASSTVTAVIAKEGWPGFRSLEVELVRSVLHSPATSHGHILACGGGVVETEEGRVVLQSYVAAGGVVVEIRRDIDDIAVTLGQPPSWELGSDGPTPQAVAAAAAMVAPPAASPSGGSNTAPAATDPGRPAYAGGASVHEVFSRRKAWYETCSSHVFPIPAGEEDWKAVNARFVALVSQVVQGCNGASSGKDCGGVALPAGAAPHATVAQLPTPTSSLTSADGCDGTGFVCLALPDIRNLINSEGSGGSDSKPSTRYPHSLAMPTGRAFDHLADKLHAIALDASAVELRVDCLASQSPDFVHFQVALLRAGLARGMQRALQAHGDPTATGGTAAAGRRLMPRHLPKPLIFTVRTATEGGKFTGSEADYCALTRLGIRSGCEYVDIECGREAFSAAAVQQLSTAAHASGCKVIASAHWPIAPPPSQAVLVSAARACKRNGDADVVKLVVSASSPSHALELQANAVAVREAVEAMATRGSGGNTSVAPSSSATEFIFLAMGDAGKLSRVANDFLTPVTHPLLPSAAAPGQLSMRQVRSLRAQLGFIKPKSYFLFGSPIAQSVSPALHNTGFEAIALPHRYGLMQTTDAAAVAAVVRGTAPPDVLSPPTSPSSSSSTAPATAALPATVGGGNVTIPLKTDILPHCDVLSPAAAAIGAVNTLIVLHQHQQHQSHVTIHGDNTDWLGVYWPLRDRLQARQRLRGGRSSDQKEDKGTQGGATAGAAVLIVGAGGTSQAVAFAARQLGYQVLVHNRTASKAADLAARYDGGVVEDLSTEWSLSGHVEIAAIVCTLPPTVGWTAPAWLLARDQPVCFDVAYRPRTTAFLAQAQAAGCQYVEGAEMLIGQGIAAFALWTGQAVHSGFLVEAGPGVPVAEMARAIAIE